jgi:RNA polymerase sigma factor (sigma-70 family)
MPNNEMVERYKQNLALSTFLARKWMDIFPFEYHDDLFEEARVGLWIACTTFNPNRGTKFSTYAGSVIINKIRNFYRDEHDKFYMTRSLQEPISHNGESEYTLEDIISCETNFDKNIIDLNLVNFVKNSEILKMYIKGMTQREIAKVFNLSQAQISRKLKTLRKEVREIIKVS